MDNIEQLLERQTAVMEALAGIVSKEGDLHTKTPATTSNFTPLHGPGGIFTSPGLEREIVTAHVRPFGFAKDLPLLPSVYVNPRFGALTGYTDVDGDQPDNACEDAPAGYVKSCTLTARFGRLRFDTQTIEMDDVMLKLHRGDFTDLILMGRVLGLSELEPSGMNENQILDIVTMSEMVGAAVQTERNLNQQIWQGAIGTANQFPGLDVQIATGQKDADTGTLCPALDSDVKDFDYDAIDGTGRDIVEYLSMLAYYLQYNALTMGLEPVSWTIVMRPQLWFELTAMWPCAYNTTKCSPTVATNSTVFLDGRENTMERDSMRQNMYIDINGTRFPVVIDTGIYEHNNINDANLAAGEYASTIYMVPTTIRGTMPVTYREYVDYRAAQSDVALLSGSNTFFWTDQGVYSWAYEETKWCYKLSLKTEQRVVLRTPHLAGRIDNVKYTPLQHVREPDPDNPYFADGGVSLRDSVGTPYAVWGS